MNDVTENAQYQQNCKKLFNSVFSPGYSTDKDHDGANIYVQVTGSRWTELTGAEKVDPVTESVTDSTDRLHAAAKLGRLVLNAFSSVHARRLNKA